MERADVILPRFVQSRLLLGVPGIYHVFCGVDPVPGRGHGERLRRVFAVPPSRVGTVRQIHSSSALELDEQDLGPPGAGRREGDALWTDRPGHGTGIHTADCVPLLLAHPAIPLVAAVHAGWRGLAAGVVGETVRSIAARFGAAAVEGLLAAAGPAAGGCCYEIGDDVAGVLASLPGGGRALRRGGAPGKWTAEIRALAAAALREAGVPPGRTDETGPCTVCSPSFHSWRREKSLTARQFSFIYIL